MIPTYRKLHVKWEHKCRTITILQKLCWPAIWCHLVIRNVSSYVCDNIANQNAILFWKYVHSADHLLCDCDTRAIRFLLYTSDNLNDLGFLLLWRVIHQQHHKRLVTIQRLFNSCLLLKTGQWDFTCSKVYSEGFWSSFRACTQTKCDWQTDLEQVRHCLEAPLHWEPGANYPCCPPPVAALVTNHLGSVFDIVI